MSWLKTIGSVIGTDMYAVSDVCAKTLSSSAGLWGKYWTWNCVRVEFVEKRAAEKMGGAMRGFSAGVAVTCDGDVSCLDARVASVAG